MDIKDKRFIEDTFPVREVSIEGAKEKNIRQGHLSTLHIWWARRPLATSRATAFAALIPTPKTEEEKQKIRNFIADLSKWENSDNDALLRKAKKMIHDASGGRAVKVFDPFGGGGSIPLEALRLGCEGYTNDYNPISVLIQYATLEYPQKFGKEISIKKYLQERPWFNKNNTFGREKEKISNDGILINDAQSDYNKSDTLNPLAEDIENWGNWVLNEANKELSEFYPNEVDGSTIVGYIWARTIPCQNPTCKAEVPLLRSFWLSSRENKQIILYPIINENHIEFKISSGDFNKDKTVFNPDNGTISRAVMNCPVCGSVTNDDVTRKLFQQGKSSQRMLVVITQNDKKIEVKKEINEIVKQLQLGRVHDAIVDDLKNEGFQVEKKDFSVDVKSRNSFSLVYNDAIRFIEFKVLIRNGKIIVEQQGKAYRLANAEDLSTYNEAEIFLERRRSELLDIWGIDPIPDEELPFMSGVFNVPLYGMNQWGKLFNSRQKVSLMVLYDKIKGILLGKKFESLDKEYRKVIAAYLCILVGRLSNRLSTLAYWFIQGEKIQPTFGRQALGMVWDYVELNPFSTSSGGWGNNMQDITFAVKHLSKVSTPITKITNLSAANLKYEDNYFDAVFTDPPYYNSVPYADLSDFFYVWYKRVLGDYFPELFSTPLSPKKYEMTEMAGWDPIRYPEKDKMFFEEQLKKAFQEVYRVLKPNGIAIIVYAHKSTSGWETVINALLDSNLVITASYPLSTEMQTRTRASESAALGSSIYIVARKMLRHGTGFYNEVKEELKNYLNLKLDQLWGEAIVGADFFIAAIGSAIEVFGKYEKVMDFEGNVKRADVLLDDVREIVMNYTIGHILHNGFSVDISELTKFYVIYRFSYGEAKLEFDEANKLARSIGIDLTQEFNKNGFIKKEKEFVRVLAVYNRKIDDLHDKYELIDVLHYSLLLWESGKKEKMMEVLAETGFGKSEAFYRVAQAISESLAKTSPESREKKLLDGFLGGKERIKSEITRTKITKRNIQGKLEF